MKPDNPMRKFDPRKVAHYEKENYVAYYQKDWLELLPDGTLLYVSKGRNWETRGVLQRATLA